MLDHSYSAKLLEVKVKLEQEQLVDRIKQETVACDTNKGLQTHTTTSSHLSKHSIEALLGSGSAPSTTNATEIIQIGSPSWIKNLMEKNSLFVNGIMSQNYSNMIKTENGGMLGDSNTPLPSITSSATTSRASSPSLPSRRSTRKKKETQVWSTYRKGML